MSFYRDGNFYGDGDFYGVSSSAPINLSYYYTDIDNVFVFSWTFNNQMFTPALATFDYELQLSLDPTFASPDFDYTSTSGIINSPGITFQDGNVYKGFAVPVYTRIATPLTFYARVRIITSLLPTPAYGDWSDVLIAQTLIDVTQQEAHNLISNLPDRHVYPYDEAYKTVTRTSSQLSTNIGKVYWAYAREFDNANLEAQLADNDSDIFRARDSRFFDIWGYPTGFQKPSTMQWVDYRNIINEFRLACFAGSTMEAVKLVVASFARVDPTITPFEQILNFILPMEEVEAYTIPSFFPYTVTLANLPRNSPSIPGYAFTDTFPIPAEQYSAGTSVSADFPSTNLTGTLTINLNGDGPQTITLGTGVTGAAVATDIQAKVRALVASSPVNQPAYNNFTAAYTTVYTLTSGTTGFSSSVVVTGASDAVALKLGLAYGGTETVGTGAGSLAPGAANLASATGFAILAATSITNVGATVVTGEMGLYPGTSVTGFPPGAVIGAEHVTDPTALAAQNDAMAAYIDLQSRPGAIDESGNVLGTGGTVPILTGGGGTNVYNFTSSAQITGALTLVGTASDIFIFQIVSTLTTASSASVVLSGVLPQNVFWAVGSSATIGSATSFQGTIIALDSITATGTGSTVDGRLIALTALVSFANASTVTVSGAGSAGTSISNSSPATTLGGTLNISVDGTPYSITLGADTAGAAVAADIQAQLRVLGAVGFTAIYNSFTGRYTLTSGTASSSSSVVVTGGIYASILKLGLSFGVETAGLPILGFFSVNFNTGVLTFNASSAGDIITVTYLDAANIASVLGDVVSPSTPVIYNRLAVGASVVITMNNPADFVIDPLSVKFLLDQIIPAHVEYILVEN